MTLFSSSDMRAQTKKTYYKTARPTVYHNRHVPGLFDVRPVRMWTVVCTDPYEDATEEGTEYARVLFLMHPWFVDSKDLAEYFMDLYPLRARDDASNMRRPDRRGTRDRFERGRVLSMT